MEKNWKQIFQTNARGKNGMSEESNYLKLRQRRHKRKQEKPNKKHKVS